MEKTIIKVDEDSAKVLEILRVKINGLYNLFSSFMNDRFEFYNEIKINDFLEEYNNINLVYESLLNGFILDNIGDIRYKEYISPCVRKCTYFDYPNKEIVIVWHEKKEV